MANLETLELQITGSAEQAKGRIGELIRSLSDLSDALTKPFSDLVDFRRELETISHVRLPNFNRMLNGGGGGSSTTAIRNRARAIAETAQACRNLQEASSSMPGSSSSNGPSHLYTRNGRTYSSAPTFWESNPRSLEYQRMEVLAKQRYMEAFNQQKAELIANHQFAGEFNNRGRFIPYDYSASTPSVTQNAGELQQAQETANRVQESANNAGQALANAAESADRLNNAAQGTTSSLQPLDNELKRKKKDGDQASQGLSNAARSAEETGRAAGEAGRQVGFMGRILNRVSRMMQTMVMRLAIKALIKSFSESFNAVYNYSKAMGGEFATSMEKMKGLLSATTTNIVTAFAPALQALLPVVNVLASAIQYLCNAITWLFQLLGMSGEFLGASTDAINAYSKSAKGGGGATKEMLAKFDELNVISSKSSGGGGGGGITPATGVLSGIVSDEMAMLQAIIGEAFLAIGLVLACTGHLGIGIGLMAIGGAAIVKTVVQDWGKLSGPVQQQIAELMAACAVGFLALGFILAATGNIGIGIGMMVLGAANMAGLVAMGFNDMLSAQVKQKVSTILEWGGMTFLAIGTILALSGHLGLGIGMMVAGAALIGTAVALNWDTAKTKIDSSINDISNILGVVSIGLFVVGAMLAFSGANIPLGIGLMLGGAAALGTAAVLQWSRIRTFIDRNLNMIALSLAVASVGLFAVGAVLAFSGANIPLGIGLMIGGVAGMVGAIRMKWDEVRSLVLENLNQIYRDLTVVGVGLFGVGAILAFSGANIPLGIGLMVAGAMTVGTIAALNWETIQGFIRDNVDEISMILKAVGSGLMVVGAVLAFSGANLPLGIGLMLGGAAMLGGSALLDWDAVGRDLRSSIRNILDILEVASFGAMAIGAVLLFSGVNIPLGLGLIAAGAAGFFVTQALDANWNDTASDISSSCEQIDGAMKGPLDTLKDLVTQGDLWQKLGDLSKKITLTVETVQKVKTVTQGSTTVKGTVNAALETAAEVNNDGSFFGNLMNTVTKIGQQAMKLMGVPTVELKTNANGAYGIPNGDLFIANEAGAELVGSINGRTSVANQDQIIEGISNGVERANAEQNNLLRQQNELLRGILAKEMKVDIGTSAQFGRAVKQSLDAYNGLAGGY